MMKKGDATEVVSFKVRKAERETSVVG